MVIALSLMKCTTRLLIIYLLNSNYHCQSNKDLLHYLHAQNTDVDENSVQNLDS